MAQYVKKTARQFWAYDNCGKGINPGDKNYVEEQRFLGSLHAKPKRYCMECYEQPQKARKQ